MIALGKRGGWGREIVHCDSLGPTFIRGCGDTAENFAGDSLHFGYVCFLKRQSVHESYLSGNQQPKQSMIIRFTTCAPYFD